MSQTFQEFRPSTWVEAMTCLNQLDPHSIFRGQSDATWELRTSIERSSFFRQGYRVEKDFLNDFQRGARSLIDFLPAPNDTLSWLALMQHHGAPTRLLDFSHSPYIASYFALESAVSDAAVWAVHPLHLKEDLAEKSPKTFTFHGDEYLDLSDAAFHDIFDRNDLSCVFPVRPSFTNRRYMAQQALFVSTGNSHSTFMEQLLSYSWPQYLSEHVAKVVLPHSIRDEALFDLNRMNVNRAVLFPDLDGFAMQLRSIYELRARGAAWVVRDRGEKSPNRESTEEAV